MSKVDRVTENQESKYPENSAGDRISKWKPRGEKLCLYYLGAIYYDQLLTAVGVARHRMISLLNNPNQPLTHPQWDIIDSALDESIHIPEKFITPGEEEEKVQISDSILSIDKINMLIIGSYINSVK